MRRCTRRTSGGRTGSALATVDPQLVDVVGDRGVADRLVELEDTAAAPCRRSAGAARGLRGHWRSIDEVGEQQLAGQPRHVKVARLSEMRLVADMGDGLQEILPA